MEYIAFPNRQFFDDLYEGKVFESPHPLRSKSFSRNPNDSKRLKVQNILKKLSNDSIFFRQKRVLSSEYRKIDSQISTNLKRVIEERALKSARQILKRYWPKNAQTTKALPFILRREFSYKSLHPTEDREDAVWLLMAALNKTLEENRPALVSLYWNGNTAFDLMIDNRRILDIPTDYIEAPEMKDPLKNFPGGFHSIVIFDRVIDNENKVYYRAINSWGFDQVGEGIVYISETYLKAFVSKLIRETR